MTLPKKYAWLADEPGPRMLLAALDEYGTLEVPGKGSNPKITGWAHECGIGAYSTDDIPWCGLFMAVCAKRAGWARPPNPLWARNWAQFGQAADTAMLGDVLVFSRGSGGHVALYVGEDKTSFHCLGGNQSDAVSITRVAKSRLIAARRPKWKVTQPANVRRVFLTPSGALSTNEA